MYSASFLVLSLFSLAKAEETIQKEGEMWIQPNPKFTSISYLPSTIENLNHQHGEGLEWGNYMHHHHAVLNNECFCHYLFDDENGYMFVDCDNYLDAFPVEADMQVFFRNSDIQLTQTDSPKIRRLNLYNVRFPEGNFPSGISMFYPERLRHFAVIDTNLRELPSGCLDDFIMLGTIKMTHNAIRELNSGVFDKLGYLESAIFHHNSITFVQKDSFHKLRLLRSIDISHNKVRTLEVGSFSDLQQINSILLQHNNIHDLLVGVFYNLKNLNTINLSNNELETVCQGVFDSLTSLKAVDLSHNKIVNLDAGVFYGETFTSLQHVDLSFNELTAVEPWPLSLPSNFLVNLEHNRIANFTNLMEWYYTCDMEPLAGKVQFSFNRITHIRDLLHGWGFNTSDAQIRIICMFRSDSLRVDLRKNPLICDCVDFEVYKYLKLTKISEIVDQLMCNKPPRLYNRKIITVPNEEFECQHDENCPKGCTCTERPAGRPFFITCLDQNMSVLPRKLPSRPRSYYRYHLEFARNNIFRVMNMSYLKYSDYLDLSNNSLQEIKKDAVEGLCNISTIKLNHNNLTTLPENIRDLFDENSVSDYELKELYLHSNSWRCDCHTVWMKHWFLSLGGRLKQPEGILCETPLRLQGRSLLGLSDEDFICGDPIDWQFVTLVLLTLAIATIVVSVHFGLHQVVFGTLKIWVYAITGLHPFDQDECQNEGMTYDVFLCFVPNDQDRAMEVKDLLCAQKYRVCVQAQIFRAGEDIFDKAATILSTSKRTICLISSEFFTSYINVWIVDHIFSDVRLRNSFMAITFDTEQPSAASDKISQHLLRYIKTHTISKTASCYFKTLSYFMPLKPLPTTVESQFSDNQRESPSESNVNSDETTMSIMQPLNVVGESPWPEFDLDESRIYDVFISFAQEEDPWVRELVANLERGDRYRVCVHNRDFVNGIPIWDNIALALDQSKRLLCVMSQHFNESTFCMWEFQAGLGMQMAGKHRVIVVLYDQLEDMTLEPTLRSYLGRYTYLEKWNPHFMEMLVKNLPPPMSKK